MGYGGKPKIYHTNMADGTQQHMVEIHDRQILI